MSNCSNNFFGYCALSKKYVRNFICSSVKSELVESVVLIVISFFLLFSCQKSIKDLLYFIIKYIFMRFLIAPDIMQLSIMDFFYNSSSFLVNKVYSKKIFTD